MTTVIITDQNRENAVEVQIPTEDKRFTIVVAEKTYHHVETTDQGVWVYAAA